MSAIPLPTPGARRQRIILTGDVPSPLDPPSGCSFHPRCWLRARLDHPAVCSTDRPELRVVANEHEAACHFAERTSAMSEQQAAEAAERVAAEVIAEAEAADQEDSGTPSTESPEGPTAG
jgi:oligopeptide/dipeptide ABC transporter ATP-binding protein